MKMILASLLSLAFPLLVSASAVNVYISESGAGSANGTSAGNAGSCGGSGQTGCSFFNNGSNWGTGANQIGITTNCTTVWIEGTIHAVAGAVNYLTFQGAGTTGCPITLKFDTAAVLTATYWSGPAIDDGQSWTVIDGNSLQGTIQATANGTSLANHQDNGFGVELGGGSNVEVKNLNIINMYVRTCGTPITTCSDEAAGFVIAIHGNGGDNVTIDGNVMHDTYTCVLYAFQTMTSANWHHNTCYNINWGLIIGDASAGKTLTGGTIHDNDIHDFQNWDDRPSVNEFHHDGIYGFTNNSGSSITGLQIYNNYIHGDPGLTANTFIFLSDSGGTVQNCVTYNNLLVNQGPVGDYPANGLYQDWGQNDSFYNNTLVGISKTDSSQGNEGIAVNPGTGLTLKNNIFSVFFIGIYMGSGASITVSDNNDFDTATLTSVAWNNVGTQYATLANWQGCTSTGGCPASHDGSSINSAPALNGTWFPTGTSPLLAGANLTSLSITPLDSDKAGVSRPGAGAWYIGAYNFAGTPPSSAGAVCSGPCSVFR